jgi:tRNA-Thr(GGU) m(6)t(6)A37 methyltransferase TsaA
MGENEKYSIKDIPEMQVIQVGIIRNQNTETIWKETWANLSWQERRDTMNHQKQVISELLINPDLDGILDGIDEYSHLLVLFWAHLSPPDQRSLTRVHPMGRQDLPLTGIFATQSPVRPNPILATVVKLIERKGNVLKVTELDALDGSPILDIKPYTGNIAVSETIKVPSWIRQL